ncbi:MAG: hypothetical protein KAI20_03200 [Thermoplasmatales archaeon]|nr:hypothetical protein [Thermoplasmatales archaeon]
MNRNLLNLYTSRDYGFKFVEMIIYDHKTKILNKNPPEIPGERFINQLYFAEMATESSIYYIILLYSV